MTCEVRRRAEEGAGGRGRRRAAVSALARRGGKLLRGGNLSTNAGGTGALAYGVARELMLGLEVVLADGRVLNLLRKLKKDNTGYDLRHLFVGAEGTLGIIIGAVLRLFPRPHAVETAFVGLPSPDAAFAAQPREGPRRGHRDELRIDLSRIVDSPCAPAWAPRSACQRHPWYVLLEFSEHPRGPARGVEELLERRNRAGVDRRHDCRKHRQAKSFWHMRHQLADMQKPEGGSIKHDVSVPVTQCRIHRRADAWSSADPRCRPVPFGHLGDGNVHYNVSQPVGADKAAFLERWEN